MADKTKTKKGKKEKKEKKNPEKKVKDIIKKEVKPLDIYLINVKRDPVNYHHTNNIHFFSFYEKIFLYSEDLNDFSFDILFTFSLEDIYKYVDYIINKSSLFFKQIFFSYLLYDQSKKEFKKESIKLFISNFLKSFFTSLLFDIKSNNEELDYIFELTITTKNTKDLYISLQGKFFFTLYKLEDDEIENTDKDNFNFSESTIKDQIRNLKIIKDPTKNYIYLDDDFTKKDSNTFFSFRLSEKKRYLFDTFYLLMRDETLLSNLYLVKNKLNDNFKVKRKDFYKKLDKKDKKDQEILENMNNKLEKDIIDDFNFLITTYII